jgi:hypothetical protein
LQRRDLAGVTALKQAYVDIDGFGDAKRPYSSLPRFNNDRRGR